jgi:heme/copper-type cytochrome/quinol oxidase subunit 2
MLQLAEGIMADLWRDCWIRETGTGQQVAQLHDRYMMMMIMIIIIIIIVIIIMIIYNIITEKLQKFDIQRTVYRDIFL